MARLLVWCVAMLAAVAAAAAAAAVVRDDTYQELDVHMKLNGAALQYIEGDLRKRIAAAAPHNEVNFTTTTPHITLYLTEYVSALLPDAIAVLNTLVPRLAAQVGVCNVTLGRPVVSGQYFMWNTEAGESGVISYMKYLCHIHRRVMAKIADDSTAAAAIAYAHRH